MNKTLLSALIVLSATSTSLANVNYFGSANQFAIDSNYAVTGVSVVKADNPVSGSPSVGTFGHGRDGFSAVTTIGTLYSGAADQAMYIGNSKTSLQNTFDHSIVELKFANGITNGHGKDLAIMIGSGKINPARMSSKSSGYWIETLAIGVDPTIKAGNYSNTLYYNKWVDYKNNASGDNGYLTFTYDLSDLGVGFGQTVYSIFVSNFDVYSTVSGADGLSGWVNLAGGVGTPIEGGTAYNYGFTPPAGANSYFLPYYNSQTQAWDYSHWDTDPDLLYAGSLGSVVPGPAAVLPFALGLLAAAKRRRK